MDTPLPASTNGDTPFLLRHLSGPVPIEIMVNVSNYMMPYSQKETDPTVNVDWDTGTRMLTHDSTTAAFAVYLDWARLEGKTPLSYRAWLQAANAVAKNLLNQEYGAKTSTTAEV